MATTNTMIKKARAPEVSGSRESSSQTSVIYWMRRDLRLEDNAALFYALKENTQVVPVFIFDSEILSRLQNPSDRRVWFIFEQIEKLKAKLVERGSDLRVYFGKPIEVFERILGSTDLGHRFSGIYCNHDYEPQAISRDLQVQKMAEAKGMVFKTYKDQVIFEKSEVLTDARKTYTVYTPYKKKWLNSLSDFYLKSYPVETYAHRFFKPQSVSSAPTLQQMGFKENSGFRFPELKVESSMLSGYAEKRDFPALEATSRLGLHLRFGTISVRELVRAAKGRSEVWLSELIWREFFMQILFHFPQVEKTSFRPEYEKIKWRESSADFERWATGQTGFPLVDAGMRELLTTGHMHNRVRMLTASFLTKHLLHHWYKGERFFAAHLLDFELAANNGNWQWAAGTGCDAAPYFRIFNPTTQIEKFDEQKSYIKKWVPEFGSSRYVKPMVEHTEARERCLSAFSLALKGK